MEQSEGSLISVDVPEAVEHVIHNLKTFEVKRVHCGSFASITSALSVC